MDKAKLILAGFVVVIVPLIGGFLGARFFNSGIYKVCAASFVNCA